MAVEHTRVTVGQFEAFLRQPESRDRRVELVDGAIVDKDASELRGLIATNIGLVLYQWCKAYAAPVRAGFSIHYRMPDDDWNELLADVSVRFTDAPPVTEGPVLAMPDLAVEIRSPDDRLPAFRARAAYYLANGARMVWLVYPKEQLVEIYTPDAETILKADDTLDGGDVLPGFALAVRDIFAL